VLCELVPGGMPKQITAGQAAHILASITPSGAVEAARCELAAEFTEDLRGTGTRSATPGRSWPSRSGRPGPA